MIDGALLRDAAEMLREGEGPRFGSADEYADWLETVADRAEAGEL